MTQGGAVLLFAPSEEDEALYGFRQDSNFYYLTGWTEPGAALLLVPAGTKVAADAKPADYTEILFLPGHNLIREKYTGPKLGAENPDAPKITGFDRVAKMDDLRDELVRRLPAGVLPAPPGAIYTDLGGEGSGTPSTRGLDWLRRANAFGRARFEDVLPLITSLRMVKDDGEMELIRKAVAASEASHQAAARVMKPGLNERNIAALMQFSFQNRGCERPAYAPIVGSGPNSTVLHYGANSRQIEDGDVVVMDVAGEYSMYAADITRTLPANGHFSPRQREIYDIVLGAQHAAEQAFQNGKSVMTGMGSDSLFRVAYEYMNAHGKDLHGQPLGQYFIHGLGHGVGLDVHDPTHYSQPLKPGMVITLEPGIYIPEEKLGVRIEDMYWVDPNGKLVKLTADLPSTADEVERAMKAGTK
jgi:Xaa-Pro aminopeptidase